MVNETEVALTHPDGTANFEEQSYLLRNLINSVEWLLSELNPECCGRR